MAAPGRRPPLARTAARAETGAMVLRRLAFLLLAVAALLVAASAHAAGGARAATPYAHVEAVDDPDDAAGPLDVASATFGQDQRDLTFSLRVRGRLERSQLGPGGSVCVLVARGGLHEQLCAGRSARALSLARVGADGRVVGKA